MTALERITEIEKHLATRCGCLEGLFLRKAFQVMREIAIEANNRTDDAVYHELWFGDIDQEFEERMK